MARIIRTREKLSKKGLKKALILEQTVKDVVVSPRQTIYEHIVFMNMMFQEIYFTGHCFEPKEWFQVLLDSMPDPYRAILAKSSATMLARYGYSFLGIDAIKAYGATVKIFAYSIRGMWPPRVGRNRVKHVHDDRVDEGIRMVLTSTPVMVKHLQV